MNQSVLYFINTHQLPSCNYTKPVETVFFLKVNSYIYIYWDKWNTDVISDVIFSNTVHFEETGLPWLHQYVFVHKITQLLMCKLDLEAYQ